MMGKICVFLAAFILAAPCAPAAKAACSSCKNKEIWKTPLKLDKTVKINDSPENVVTRPRRPAPEQSPAYGCGFQPSKNTWYYRELTSKDVLDNIDTYYQGRRVFVLDQAKTVLPADTRRVETKPLKKRSPGEPIAMPRQRPQNPVQRLPHLGILRHRLEPRDLQDLRTLSFSPLL
ncbi:MAG: hypothetical protein PHW69_07245 [Elusimicrobiaceae bacterium]|nr:hypothetical protein [Elusimicrobiaceae bacterium]